MYFLLSHLQCYHPVRSRMIRGGVEMITSIQKLLGKGHLMRLFLLFKTEVSSVSILKYRARVSLCADVSLAYTVY